MKKLWDKLMKSDILPFVWGLLFVLTITATLTAMATLTVKWALTLLGVII